MLGSSGPSVTLQSPVSSLVNLGVAAPGSSQSPVSVTSDALGARMRKVTLRSGWTSGDTTVAGRCPYRAADARREIRQVRRRVTELAPVFQYTAGAESGWVAVADLS